MDLVESTESMKVERLSTEGDVARRAADIVAEVVGREPEALILLPAGGTPVPLYAELVRRCARGELDLSRARFVQLDEIVGLAPDDARSFHRFLRFHLLDRIGERGGDLLLDGAAADPACEIERHARALDEAGAPDLVLLGLGRNGHVAFNEPGSSLAQGARVVALDRVTAEALAEPFDGGLLPSHGMTLGLAEIASGARIVLLVTGASKAPILEKLTREAPSPELPASQLTSHGDLTVLVDATAGPS